MTRRAARHARSKKMAMAVIAVSGVAYMYLHAQAARKTPPPAAAPSQGYEAGDRRQLEQLIHEGADHD